MKTQERRDINLALLIDVDNVSSGYIERILSELSNYGKITIRRMYGDWSQNRLSKWLQVASRYSLTPIMQPNSTPGKNASDIGLIIDAMDVLYGGDVEGFCIVSSDSDFYRLATRIREAGKLVIGMGERKTPESFRASCERFIFLDVLDDPMDSSLADDNTNVKMTQGSQTKTKSSDTSADIDIVSKEALEITIANMINDNTAIGRETLLSEIGERLVKIYPDFDIRNYGYSKLSAFVKDLPSLMIYTENTVTMIGLKVSSIQEIENQIEKIYRENGSTVLNIGYLHNALQLVNPSLTASVRQSGVTKFSQFLNTKLSCTRVVDKINAEYIGPAAAEIKKSAAKKAKGKASTKQTAPKKKTGSSSKK